MRISKSLLILFILFSTKIVTAQEKVPLEAFAALPSFTNVKLSPDGKQIGYMLSIEGRMQLILQNLDGSNTQRLGRVGEADISDYHWATDDRVLLIFEQTLKREQFTTKTLETRLAGINRIASDDKDPLKAINFQWLVKQNRVKRVNTNMLVNIGFVAQIQHDIIDFLKDDPENILLSLDGDLDGRDEIRRVNINTGNYRQINDGREGIQNWVVDQNSTPRLGYGFSGSKRQVLIKTPEGKWESTRKSEWLDNFSVQGFTEDPDIVFVSGYTQYGTRGLFKLKMSTGEIIEQLFTHEKVDMDYAVEHPETGVIVGAAYTIDRQLVHYFDENLAKVQRVIDKALKGTNNRIVGKANGKEVYIIRSFNDQDAGVYYYFDRTAGKIDFVSAQMNQIDPALMAKVKPITFKARDGLEIPGYLTLPPGKENATGLPTVIMPHGGPRARDTGDWDFWAQFVANRGFAVLQPNFRGSTGYGYKFRDMGTHQWGGVMQDDVTDATKWMIAEGISDPEKICIVGASYGGYAALMGAIKEPNLYKCALSVNGVTNISRMKSQDKKFIGGSAWVKTMGLEGTSDDDVSPHHRADEINIPVLIMSSEDDARIDYRQSERTHKKLEDLGKDSTYIKIENGGHTMDTEKARLAVLKATEKFLEKHIGN